MVAYGLACFNVKCLTSNLVVSRCLRIRTSARVSNRGKVQMHGLHTHDTLAANT